MNNSRMRKPISMLLAIVVAVGLMPELALAREMQGWQPGLDSYGSTSKLIAAFTTQSNEIISSGTSGTCSWTIDSDGALIIIPTNGTSGELGDNIGTKAGNVPAWLEATENKSLIRSVQFTGVIKARTCASMFSGCSSLASVNLTGLDTSDVTDMSYMFNGCSALRSFDFTSLDYSSVADMECMFCSSGLTSIDLHGLTFPEIDRMYGMFYECKSLKNANLSGMNIPNATSLTILFSDCPSLESVNLSNLALGPTALDRMFQRCASLTNVVFDGIDSSRVTDMSYMFSGCSGLKILDLSKIDTSNVSGVASMFSGCSSLESIDLSCFSKSNINGFSGLSLMFSGCSSLKSLDMTSFDTSKVVSMAGMFYGCTNLKSLDISTFDTAKVSRFVVSDMGMFGGCSSLENISVGSKATSELLSQLPAYEINGHSDWYSQADENWFAVSEIAGLRAGVADTYTKSATVSATFSVMYDANGGTGTPSTQTKQENVALTLSSVIPTKAYTISYNASGGSVSPASKSVSCAFKNWNTERNGGGVSYNSGASYSSNADATLYAQWTNPAAGTLATPSRSGYEFAGWYTSATGGNQVNASTTVTGNMTLYAHWSDPYNLGDETYSFHNYSDYHADGHCFGMAMTSAGYHNNLIDIQKIGGTSNTPLYSFNATQMVKQPICYYHQLQGPYAQRAIVAGGSYDLSDYKFYDIGSDWPAVVNYVKNHNYDDIGLLELGYWKRGVGGHSVNFLRYQNVNGQDRLYAYDNNFPDRETYFYRDASGRVLQAPVQTISGEIDSIELSDVRTYFGGVGRFNAARVLYVAKDGAVVEGCTPSDMKGDDSGIKRVMYEIPDGVDSITVIPKRNNADFIYMDTEYSFGEITEKTRGELKLASSTDKEAGSSISFTIYEADSAIPDVTLSKASYTYDGSVHKPDVTVKVGGDTLRETSDYTIEYPTGMRDAGKYEIKVTLKGQYSGSATKAFTIEPAAQAITATDKTVRVGETVSLDAKASTNGALKYSSSDLTIATVNADGVVSGKKTGKAVVTISTDATANYKSASKTINITVIANDSAAHQTITASDKSVAMGKTVALGAETSGDGKLTYESSDTTVAKVDASGKVTPVRVGKATVTITASKTVIYAVAKKTITVTVAKGANPLVAKGKTATVKASKVKKAKQTVSAKTAYTVEKAQGKITYKKASGNKKITVASNGKITVKKGLKKGTYKVEVKVTAKGNADWKSKSKTVTVTIKIK